MKIAEDVLARYSELHPNFKLPNPAGLARAICQARAKSRPPNPKDLDFVRQEKAIPPPC